ncbi:hypothetical protein [Alkaliflexus imshenetskii]|uniref:hypothetical protein n=1 Tax=Alkaliflexus imshenetskii TaxID=286730 RepID=UPI00047AB034|nr:hypothetical protein [Alkaliflexus imshenetskii]
MKKKIFFAIATAFFAVATVFNMNALQGGSVGDISLDAIAVMAQAQRESGGGGGYTCSASATCYSVQGKESGSVSCSGTDTCVAGYGYVTCDGKTSYCA